MVFDSVEIRDALDELTEELARRNVVARILIVGGAAMALAYYERDSTNDIDGMYQPADEVNQAARAVAEQQGYPPDWLNDKVKQFAPPSGDLEPQVILERNGVTISVAGPKYMLAMKLLAARGRRDTRDVEVLLDACDIQSLEQARELLESFYPDHLLSDKARALVRTHLEAKPEG